jgi:hypothetical protein
MRGPTSGRRNGRVKLRGSLMSEVGRRAGAAPDDRAAARRQRAGCGSKAERRRRRTSVRSPIHGISPETGGCGLLGCSVLVAVQDRLARPVAHRTVEVARRVAVARDDAPGVQLGADPADRSMSERGKRPGGARRTLRGLGQAHRPLLPPGRGGGPVVVVAVTRHQGGRESRPQGEGVQ